MDILCIFKSVKQSLYAFRYKDEQKDEMERLFDLWQDLEYLEDFFNKNKNDLLSGFYGQLAVEDAVLQTREDAKELQKQLLDLKNEKCKSALNNYFKPLDNITYKPDDLEKNKAYGVLENSWIRLYAIKAPHECYIITGGAIKLTKRMGDRRHTQKELDKLDRCRDFLRNEGVFDEDGIRDISLK